MSISLYKYYILYMILSLTSICLIRPFENSETNKKDIWWDESSKTSYDKETLNSLLPSNTREH